MDPQKFRYCNNSHQSAGRTPRRSQGPKSELKFEFIRLMLTDSTKFNFDPFEYLVYLCR